MSCRNHLVMLAAVLFIALAGPAAAAQTRGDFTDVLRLPEGVIGERIQETIDVFAAGDPDAARAYIEKNFAESFRRMVPMEQHLDVFAAIHRQSRGFEFYGIRTHEEPAPAGERFVIVRNKLTEGWHAFAIMFEPEPPHRISMMRFLPARPPKEFPALENLTDDQIVANLETFVKRLTDADVFSGTVLLARDGKTLFKYAGGLASKRFGAPNRVDTRFNLGSMNKMFTSVAIVRLVQDGKLTLDDSLGDYLSEDWLPRAITAKIRIRHLLTHTSGLGNYFNETFDKSSRLRFRNLDDYKPLIREDTLAFEPGTDWSYSNTGMFLLGVVIEKVTGQSYFECVRQVVYDPAGIHDTDCYEMDRPVPNLAIGYSRDGDGWTNNIFKHVVKGGPAGGGFSTVEDLLKFDQALRGHKLLDEAHTDMAWSAKPELGSPGYGFGFSVAGSPDDRIVGHGGGFAGISANLDMFLDSGYTAVVLSNYDFGAEPVKTKLRELIAARG